MRRSEQSSRMCLGLLSGYLLVLIYEGEMTADKTAEQEAEGQARNYAIHYCSYDYSPFPKSWDDWYRSVREAHLEGQRVGHSSGYDKGKAEGRKDLRAAFEAGRAQVETHDAKGGYSFNCHHYRKYRTFEDYEKELKA